MADQGVSNERRRELEQMDPFQANLIKGLTYASKYKKQLMLGLGALGVVLVLFLTVMYSFQKAETTAATLAARAGTAYDAAYSKNQDAQAAYEAVQEAYQQLFEEYANTTAGRMAQVTYAKICANAKDWESAYTYYANALEHFDNEAGMQNMILAALGNMALMKKDVKKAKSFYLRIEKGASPLMKDEARFALAQIYESDNDMASGLKMYEKILQDNENSLYAAIAQAKSQGN
jgi:tetratricopeptide (TPR) repeat protein